MKIAGWHGGPRKIVGSFRTSPSSEGTGIYISENRELAEYFGYPHKVEAHVRHPLIVDHEDLPGLEGHLMRGWFEHMRPSVWIKANYEASKICGLLDLDYDDDPEEYLKLLNSCFPNTLAGVLMTSGYDAVKISVYGGRIPDQINISEKIRELDVSWWVVFDSKKVKFKRTDKRSSHLSAASDYGRHWRDLIVDYELRDDWLERMNSIPHLRIDMTCAGHEGKNRSRSWIMVAPFFYKAARYEFNETKEREEFMRRIEESFQDIATIEWLGMPEDQVIGFKIVANTPRLEMTEEQFASWWETVIHRLEVMGA